MHLHCGIDMNYIEEWSTLWFVYLNELVISNLHTWELTFTKLELEVITNTQVFWVINPWHHSNGTLLWKECHGIKNIKNCLAFWAWSEQRDYILAVEPEWCNAVASDHLNLSELVMLPPTYLDHCGHRFNITPLHCYVWSRDAAWCWITLSMVSLCSGRTCLNVFLYSTEYGLLLKPAWKLAVPSYSHASGLKQRNKLVWSSLNLSLSSHIEHSQSF